MQKKIEYLKSLFKIKETVLVPEYHTVQRNFYSYLDKSGMSKPEYEAFVCPAPRRAQGNCDRRSVDYSCQLVTLVPWKGSKLAPKAAVTAASALSKPAA